VDLHVVDVRGSIARHDEGRPVIGIRQVSKLFSLTIIERPGIA
jgi:hypothetical protein